MFAQWDVIVIGGVFTRIVAAHNLKQRVFNTAVLEADDRLGKWTNTIKNERYTVEQRGT